jgi:hypothetical protein
MVRRSSLIFLLAIFLLGCRPVQAPPTTAPVVPSPAAATMTAIPVTPTLQVATLIRNAKYQLGLSDSLQVVQLKDGKFEQGTSGSADYISVTLTDFVAVGDLDGDGKDEVAALIAENFGGTGVFVFLTVYKMTGATPTFLTSAIIDDRAQPNALSIEDNEVFVDITVHATDDPMCCPTLHTARHYRLINDQLDMADYSTFTPDGRPRTIKIESPSSGTPVSSSIRVKGTVLTAPFENSLVFSLKDGAGVELSRGAVPVTAADPAAPGTFEALIPLGNALTSGVIVLEIQDVSAADGSLQAMDSVELVVK